MTKKTENQTRTKNSLEDVIHEIIGHAILLGESMHRGQAMGFVTVSELKNKATQIVSEIENSREEVIVTKKGKPVVLMRFHYR